MLTINGIWDRIFCELGIDGLSWSACNGSTKIWRAHFDRPWEFYALNFLDENDDIFRLFPFVAYMNRGDVLGGGHHCVGQGTKRGRRKFWECRISMIYLCSKSVKNCNIFWQILNIWVKLILKKKKLTFFFQCLGLPKDPQSFGSQNLRCPFSVSQYYRHRRLCQA